MMEHLTIASAFLVAVLLGSLWQAPLFAVSAWSVLRMRPGANATTRHSVFVVALVASLIGPVVAAAASATYGANAPRVAGESTVPAYVGTHVPPKREARVPTRRAEPEARPTTTLSVPSFVRLRVHVPAYVALAIAAAWLAGAGLVLIRLAVSLLHLERLKRDAMPLPVTYRAKLTRWAAARKGSRHVRLCTSDEIEVPVAVGLFDAMILVPSRLLEELEPDDIDSIVLHELAHLRRSDDWINAIERFGHALLFFNPAIAWIAGHLDLEREVACDDWVLQQNDALPYATALAKVVESTVWPYRAMTAPGAFVTRRGMSIRIERLLAKQRDVRVRTSFGPAGTAVAVLSALGVIATLVSPSIAYGLSAPVPPPHRVANASVPLVAPIPAPVVRPVSVVADANDPDYIDELAAAGYPNLSVDDLIKLKQLGVTAAFIRGIERAGVAHPSVDDLVRFRALGVEPAYVGAMRRRFGSALDIEQITEMKAVGVTPAFADALRASGLKSLDANQLRNLRALGVSPDYVRGLVKAGYPNLTAEQFAQLRAMGVDGETVSRAAAHGFHNLSVDELIRLKATGVL